MQKSHKKTKVEKMEFDFVILDKNKDRLETWAWTHKPVVELILSQRKAKKIRYWQIRDAKTDKKLIMQKCKLTLQKTPKGVADDPELCSVSIDLSKLFHNMKQIFKIK